MQIKKIKNATVSCSILTCSEGFRCNPIDLIHMHGASNIRALKIATPASNIIGSRTGKFDGIIV